MRRFGTAVAFSAFLATAGGCTQEGGEARAQDLQASVALASSAHADGAGMFGTAGITARRIHASDYVDFHVSAISPDHRFVAFDRSPGAGESDESDIYLLSSDGRQETRLVRGPGADERARLGHVRR
jgi:hypothetical protein